MLKFNEFILESKLENINEGYREIILSLLFLVGGTGLTMAQKSDVKKNLKDQTFIKQAEDFINDSTKINKMGDILGQEVVDKIKSNKELIKDKLKDDHKIGSKTINIKNTDEIEKLLNKGWSPVDIKITKDTTIKPEISDKFDIEVESKYPNDAVFKTGSYELTDEFKSNLKHIIDSLSTDNTITKVTIETSTDKEPIKIGNKKLSENRTNSVSMFINGILTNIKIEKDIKFDQGPDIYKLDMSSKERELARIKTEEFRYVKLTIYYEKKLKEIVDNPEPVYITDELLVLKRINLKQKSSFKFKFPKLRIKKFKFKRRGNSFDCIYY